MLWHAIFKASTLLINDDEHSGQLTINGTIHQLSHMIKINYGIGQEILLENFREMEETLASLYMFTSSLFEMR